VSFPELKGWLFSFGEEAHLIKPDWLVQEIKESIKAMRMLYGDKKYSPGNTI